jgi:hypothetical protein
MSKYKPLTKAFTPTTVKLTDGLHKITGTQARIMWGKIAGAKVIVYPFQQCSTADGQDLGEVLIPFDAQAYFDDELDGTGQRDEWLIVVKDSAVIGGAPACQPSDVSTIEEVIQQAKADQAERARRRAAMDAFLEDGNDPDEYESREEFDEAFKDFYSDWEPPTP